MTSRKTNNFRHLHFIAAVIIVAMVAAACGGDDPEVSETSTPTDTVTTTQPLVPGTTTSVLGPEAPTEEDPPGDSGAPSETTMTDDDESSVIEDAGDVLVDEPATDDADTPSEETEPAVIPEPSDDPSESGDDTEGTLDTQPESGSETEPVSEPEQPEAAPEATEIDTIVCVRDADDTLICPEVVPDDYSCENIDGDLLCRSSGDESEPEPAPETGQPAPDPEQPEVVTEESITCERGTDGVLACPEVVPADYWCENVDNDLVCHPPSTAPDPEPTQSQTVDWTPPVAGMVPETHPDAPLREWERGPVNPDARANDYPRLTNQTLAWADWCSGVFSSCRWLMHEMHQALDYLGANPRCVLNIYTQKVNHYLEQGSGVNASYAANNFGWHLCASVIDPIVRDLPTDRPATDVGFRLSDVSGITLADRCRTVLTDVFPDIQLEARWRGETAPTQFGSDCDAWAAWVMANPLISAPACNASASLAEEWMEHHHNQHERYNRPHC